jgi:hypothetical protein
MLKKINLLVERPGETRVRVVVQVSSDPGPVEGFDLEVRTKGGVGGRGRSDRPAALDTSDVVSRATLDAFLDHVTRFEPADSLITVQAFERDALRLLVVLDVRDPIPDPIPVDLIHHG